jgi:isopentenyl diphosphate isomerase/L-lactate dehydrogenase-like FMN-dependent dehydrogenase
VAAVGTALDQLWSVEDFEAFAEQAMRPAVRTLVQAGAGGGENVRANREAWRAWYIRPRSLVDVSFCDLSTTVLGAKISLPVLMGPSGLHGLVHAGAEAATASAAREVDTLMVMSMGASLPIERVAKEDARHWMQLYWGEDRAFVRDLVQRAAEAGFLALCLTTDMPVRPWLRGEMRVALAELGSIVPAHMPPRVAHLDPRQPWDHDPRLTWEDLAWLRSVSGLPIVLKGIMTPEDARLAAEHGASAVIVSNHGGRALADAPPTAAVLASIVDAVAGQIEVLVDGGVRTGADVLKALALGARAVLVGRPVLWGLALGGAEGVQRVFELLRNELCSVFACAGIRTPGEINRATLCAR